MSNLEEKLNRFIESVDFRLDEINRKLESRHSAEERTYVVVTVRQAYNFCVRWKQGRSLIKRRLTKNTSDFDQDSLETLRAAATLSAAGRSSGGAPEDRYTNRRGFSGSGRGRYGNGQRGAFNGRSQDVFQSFTNRQFPRRQQWEDSYAAADSSGN
ncbi:hypothetical protein DPMN_168696 [Dreissena polymorpha]|uniref:Uncharacterized protein n=1 Tax=Dreissena polymorpha TaxID=45954 RepID=A0A9D4F152_DREPO|nr:hypothetical protein DPMN_168696 [Dreissena polymorpha]